MNTFSYILIIYCLLVIGDIVFYLKAKPPHTYRFSWWWVPFSGYFIWWIKTNENKSRT